MSEDSKEGHYSIGIIGDMNGELVKLPYSLAPHVEVSVRDAWDYFTNKNERQKRFDRSSLINFCLWAEAGAPFDSEIRFSCEEMEWKEFDTAKAELIALMSQWRARGGELAKAAIDLLSTLCGEDYCDECDEGREHDFTFGDTVPVVKDYVLRIDECRFYKYAAKVQTPEEKAYLSQFGDGSGYRALMVDRMPLDDYPPPITPASAKLFGESETSNLTEAGKRRLNETMFGSGAGDESVLHSISLTDQECSGQIKGKSEVVASLKDVQISLSEIWTCERHATPVPDIPLGEACPVCLHFKE